MKISRWLINGIIILSVAGLVASCAIQKSNQKYEDTTVEKANTIYTKNRVEKPTSLVTTSDEIFLSNEHFVIAPKQILPPVFEQHVLYSTAVSETLAQTVANISKLAKLPIVFADDKNTQAASQKINTAGITVYQGTVQQVIGQLATRYGLFWNYEKNKVNIFLLETKVYALDAPIGAFTTDSTVSSTSETSAGGSSGGSSSSTVSGTSDVNLKYSVKADSPWTAALTTLKDMLSPAGKIQGNAAEGYVTVTDNPDVQEKVASYIEKINKKTNQKIAVRVDVYDVQTSNTSDFGLDVNAVASVLSGDQMNIVTHPGTQLNPDLTGSFSTLTVSSASGSTHNAILSALNTLGKTTVVAGATVYTISGQPAPIQSVEEQTYLASSSTTVTQNSSQTSLTPGTIVTGYSMMVTPKIESNNQVMLMLNLQLSTLLELKTITSATGSTATNVSTIQGPVIDTKNFLESMVLHSGQSLLIAGLQDDKGSSKTSSPGSTDYWALGGGKSTSKTKTTTVIVVTPYIIGD
jgi:type IVB pilus formation R64 PilN family outer membrane protein